jgi:hypothetical protein
MNEMDLGYVDQEMLKNLVERADLKPIQVPDGERGQ